MQFVLKTMSGLLTNRYEGRTFFLSNLQYVGNSHILVCLCFDMYKCTYMNRKKNKGTQRYKYKTIHLCHCSFPGEIRTLNPCILSLFHNLKTNISPVYNCTE